MNMYSYKPTLPPYLSDKFSPYLPWLKSVYLTLPAASGSVKMERRAATTASCSPSYNISKNTILRVAIALLIAALFGIAVAQNYYYNNSVQTRISWSAQEEKQVKLTSNCSCNAIVPEVESKRCMLTMIWIYQSIVQW